MTHRSLYYTKWYDKACPASRWVLYIRYKFTWLHRGWIECHICVSVVALLRTKIQNYHMTSYSSISSSVVRFAIKSSGRLYKPPIGPPSQSSFPYGNAQLFRNVPPISTFRLHFNKTFLFEVNSPMTQLYHICFTGDHVHHGLSAN